MREAAANFSVSGGVECKLICRRGCVRRLLTLGVSGAIVCKLTCRRRCVRWLLTLVYLLL